MELGLNLNQLFTIDTFECKTAAGNRNRRPPSKLNFPDSRDFVTYAFDAITTDRDRAFSAESSELISHVRPPIAGCNSDNTRK